MAVEQRFCGAGSLARVQSFIASAQLSQRNSASSVCILHSHDRRNPVTRVQYLPATGLCPHRRQFSISCSSVSEVRRSVSTRLHAFANSSSDVNVNPKPEKVAFKHLLLPVIDRNPYLSDSTRQTIATTTALAKQYGADVTVVVIDHHQGSDEAKDTQGANNKHQTQLDTIRWHLSEGGCEDYTLVERIGEGQRPAAVIGEMADELGLDLVVMSMEAIHHKHVDGNLLGEFVPCPVLMLPL